MSSGDPMGYGRNRWVRRERGIGNERCIAWWVGGDGKEVPIITIRIADGSCCVRAYL